MPAAGAARPIQLSEKIVAELRDLHEQNAKLSRDAGGPRGRAGRRQRREARHAEDDLLRVLGFESYDDFERALADHGRDAPDASNPSDPPDPSEPASAGPRSAAPPEAGAAGAEREPGARLAAVDEQPEAEAAQAREALRTEAALLRILRDDNLAGSRQAPRADAVDELRARVAAAEEELAEARFEIGQLRDALSRAGGPTLRAAPRPEPVEALAEATAELRALYELLRAERAEIAALGERMRADAERMLHDVRARADQLREQARADAKRIRDDADAAAHEAVAAARAEAVALTRNAMVTVDGLRRLAQEHGSGDEPRG